MRRANIGCETQQPDSWHNFDIIPGTMFWDIREPFPMYEGFFDYAVANHVLSALTYDELPDALANIRAVLKPGGVLRIMDVNVLEGFAAYVRGDLEWFPYDHRMDDIDVRFSTWITWFGTRRSVFTLNYLESLLDEAGFVDTIIVDYKVTSSGLAGICDLDDRERESVFVEATA